MQKGKIKEKKDIRELRPDERKFRGEERMLEMMKEKGTPFLPAIRPFRKGSDSKQFSGSGAPNVPEKELSPPQINSHYSSRPS